MNKAAWQDVKGAMVLAGTYEEAVKMMGDMNFLQVWLDAGWHIIKQADLLLGEWLHGYPNRWKALRAEGWHRPSLASCGCTHAHPPHPASLRPCPQSLVNFPKEAINDETVELLQPYFAAPDFNYESAKKASGNVAGLCNWAASMCKYHEVAKVGGQRGCKQGWVSGQACGRKARKQFTRSA